MLGIIDACKSYLKIKHPVTIIFKDRIWKNSLGVHWAEVKDNAIKCHIIKLSLKQLPDDTRNINTVLAHEFVHAWQAEYRPIRKKVHNPSFIKKAKDLQGFLGYMGYPVTDLYLPDTDIS
jgi:hypothetical protein